MDENEEVMVPKWLAIFKNGLRNRDLHTGSMHLICRNYDRVLLTAEVQRKKNAKMQEVVDHLHRRDADNSARIARLESESAMLDKIAELESTLVERQKYVKTLETQILDITGENSIVVNNLEEEKRTLLADNYQLHQMVQALQSPSSPVDTGNRQTYIM